MNLEKFDSNWKKFIQFLLLLNISGKNFLFSILGSTLLKEEIIRNKCTIFKISADDED